MIRFSSHDAPESFRACGGKAWRLAVMQAAGLPVPPFFCVTAPCSPQALEEAAGVFPDCDSFAVRSSAQGEDGADSSFAGQFTTCLEVRRSDLADAVKRCFASADSPTVRAYLAQRGQRSLAMQVIVQPMVPAQLSGVLFTQNPLGILSEAVLTVGRGLGSGVVEDRTDTTTYYHNFPDHREYAVRQGDSPLLDEAMRRRLYDAGKQAEALFSPGMDLEFAICRGELFLLQARPITTLPRGTTPLVIDNSNLVESYPGLTLPLTESFIKSVYSDIFTCLLRRLSGSDRITASHPEIFRSMVESWNGRMFYRINSWYFVLQLLPFSRRIIPVWQEMLGVTEDLPLPAYPPTPRRIKGRIACSFAGLLFTTPGKMRKLRTAFDQAERYYRTHFREELSCQELFSLYEYLQNGIMKEWDITLANDLYTFLMTARYKRALLRRGMSQSACHGAISGIQTIESLKPVRRLAELAAVLRREGESPVYQALFRQYLEDYGDRSIGELKLETETFRERPELLTEQVRAFAEMEDPEAQLTRTPAPLPRSRLANKVLRGIENREFSRMNRSRLYGFARRIFLTMGEKLAQEGRIDACRDVFYLTVQELGSLSDEEDYRSRIRTRKLRYEAYESLPAYQRAVFAEHIVQKPLCQVTIPDQTRSGDTLVGTPCSSGAVRGTVVVVREADSSLDTAGKIIVTHSTDPGWVFLLTRAKGIVAEKGSLLSHTAILSRELHIPAIVGAAHATELLKNGDLVELDCDTGLVRKLRDAR